MYLEFYCSLATVLLRATLACSRRATELLSDNKLRSSLKALSLIRAEVPGFTSTKKLTAITFVIPQMALGPHIGISDGIACCPLRCNVAASTKQHLFVAAYTGLQKALPASLI